MKKIKERIKAFILIIFKIIKKNKLIFIISICVILFIMGLVRDIKNNKQDKESNDSIVVNETEYEEKINIKIIGAVNKDYSGQIEKGLFLYKIIDIYCLGLSDNADIEGINFANIINNDYELIISEINETNDNTFYTEDYSSSKNKEYRYNGRVNGKLIIYIVNEGISEEDYKLITKSEEIQDGNTLLNINTATLEQLIEIGLGKSKSEKLIEYRNQNGKFNSIEEITNVSGIGSATYEKIKDKICAK